jgi:glycosyltransferase involved in cell wall biosynthesis
MWLPKHKSIATYLDLFTTTNPERAGAGMGYSKWKREIGRRYFDLGSKIAKRCRFLICISEKTKQDVIEHIKPDERKLRVIRLGIQDDLQPIMRNNARFKIGTLSQLDKRKRIDLLIKQFRASKIDADLIIAGQGSDKELLTKMAEGDDRIKFSGLVPNDRLNRWYNSLDLFCFPTGIEGYGLPAVESFACGKPVVVLDDAIIPDEIMSRCFRVHNYTDLFDNENKIDTVLRTNSYKDNLAFSRLHRWSYCVDEYIKLYEEIANG